MRMGELGFWWRSVGGPPAPRAPLPGPAEADVAIVGAGFTGLWTAYYLKRARPSLRVVVLEAEQAGFGASGRNGGWLSGFFSGPPRAYAQRGHGGYRGPAAGDVRDRRRGGAASLAEHGIDADLVQGGNLTVALDRAQLARLREEIAAARGPASARTTCASSAPTELGERVRVAGSARRRLLAARRARAPGQARGRAGRGVEALGVEIYERTPVAEIAPGGRATPAGNGLGAAGWCARPRATRRPCAGCAGRSCR